MLLRGSVRHVSTYLTLPSLESSQARLRVPLLKSPSHVGHATLRVNRLYNEDRYSAAVLNLPLHDGAARTVFNFSIFDGHGGEQCSSYLASHLSEFVEGAGALASPAGDKERDELAKKYWKNIGGYWKRWYKHRRENFEAMAGEGIQICEAAAASPGAPTAKVDRAAADDLPLRVPLAFLAADYAFFERPDNASGSTCTSAFLETLHATPSLHYFNRGSLLKLTVAHVGDTRAILVDRHGAAHALTQSHHPSNPAEASRLRKYAALFFMTDSFGEERFVLLANTRAFGDLNFKQMGVLAEPQVLQMVVGDRAAVRQHLSEEEIARHTVGGLGGDEGMLILVTDGVTDVITDQEVADICMAHVNMKGLPRGSPQVCAEEVLKFVEYVGGDDNATCVVVRLSGWGLWPTEDRTGELRQERMNDYSPRGER